MNADMLPTSATPPRPNPSTRPARSRRGLAWSQVLGAAAAVAALGGCASDNKDLVRQLDQMQGEIREVRGTGLATQDRLDSVERQLAALREQARETAAQNPDDRPTLPVIRLSPEQPPGAETPAAPSQGDGSLEAPDDGRRPVLRGDDAGAHIESNGHPTDGSKTGRSSATKRPGTGRRPARATSTATGGR